MKRKYPGKYRLKLFTTLMLLHCFALVTHACDLCGGYVGILPFDNQNSLGIMHRYRVFNGYASQNQQSQVFPSGAYRLPDAGTHSPLHGAVHSGNAMAATDYESFKVIELRMRYFIAPRIEVNALVPLVNNKQVALGEKARVFGLGDITVFGGYHIIQKQVTEKFRHRLVAGLGIKIPTGANNLLYENDNDRLPLMIQPGTGSVDGMGLLAYSTAWKNWRAGLTAFVKVNGQNKFDERVMPSVTSTIMVSYQYKKDNWLILPQLQVFQEYTQGITKNNYVIPGTGMNMVMAGPGVDVYWKKIGMSMCFQLPVYQEVFEMNMKAAARFMVGITYSIEAKKYLFN